MVKIMDGPGHDRAPGPRPSSESQACRTGLLRSALDPEMHHSVPYMLTTTVIAFLKNGCPISKPPGPCSPGGPEGADDRSQRTCGRPSGRASSTWATA
jgi:hypothetical protein